VFIPAVIGATVVGLLVVAWILVRYYEQSDAADAGPLRWTMAVTVVFTAVLIAVLYLRS
jgi:hypothetical protein